MKAELIIYAIVSTCVIAVASNVCTGQTMGDEYGQISGVVKDIFSNSLSGATITIVSAGAEFKARSNNLGEFKIDLPAGRYSMKAWSPGFYESHRSSFDIKPRSLSIFNIQLITVHRIKHQILFPV